MINCTYDLKVRLRLWSLYFALSFSLSFFPTEEYLPVLTDAMRYLSASFSALSQTRKDMIGNDLGEPLPRLCTWETNIGVNELLDCDIGINLSIFTPHSTRGAAGSQTCKLLAEVGKVLSKSILSQGGQYKV